MSNNRHPPSQSYHSLLTGAEPIRQGDILKLVSTDADDEMYPQLVVTLTADCDFVHDKNRGIITCLGVITVDEYLDLVYAPSELRRIKDQTTDNLSNLIYEADRERNPTARPLPASTIKQWIEDRGVQEFLEELDAPRKKAAELKKILPTFLLLYDDSKPRAMETLREIWKLQDKALTTIQNLLSQTLKKGIGLDYILVPTLPNVDTIGFLIDLRRILSISIDQIARSEYALRTTKHSEAHYIRLGRFSDRVRFYVAQRAMQVFCRIGLDNTYESDSETAVSLVSEQLFNGIREPR